MAKKKGRSIGAWAFIIGLVIALVIAIFSPEASWPTYLLIVLGLIVGLLNVAGNEVNSFLIATIAFMFTFTALGAVMIKIPTIGADLSEFFELMNTFVGPAAGIVAFRALFSIAKE